MAHAFRARAGGLLVKEGKLDRELRQPLYIEQGTPEERWDRDPALRGRYASYWSYPLKWVDGAQLGFPVPYPWLPRELELMEAAAEHFRQSRERALLWRSGNGWRQPPGGPRMTNGRRIGRELHDEAGQSLLSLRLQLESDGTRRDPPVRPSLQEARGVLERTVVELRRIIAAAQPCRAGAARPGAGAAPVAGRFGRTFPAGVRVRIAGRLEDLPPSLQQVIYRVAQEALQNAGQTFPGNRRKTFP